MSRHTQTLWLQLQAHGLVDGELPLSDHDRSPWYIKVLLGFSGWLAAIFLMGFVGVGLEFIIKDPAASFITGIIMIAIAFAVLRIPKNEFVEHLALAISLAGQGWVLFSLFDFMDGQYGGVWFLIGLVELFLALLMPNFVHRVFSSFAAAIAFSIALIYGDTPYLFSGVIMFAAAWLWLHEFNYPQQLQKIQATAYGLVLALIPLKGTTLFGQEMLSWNYRYSEIQPWTQPWMGEVLTGMVTLFVVYTLLQRYTRDVLQRIPLFILGGTLILCLVSLEARGLTVGMTILILGFANSNRVLMGLGIISLLFYISTYYYLLDTSLLNKSFSLIAIGIVLLALHWFMKNKFVAQSSTTINPATQEPHHD